MKKNRWFFAILFIAGILTVITGCEYDVAKPQWEQDFVSPAKPEITQIDPANVAAGGVNTITIIGRNFAEVMKENKVYFDDIRVDVVEGSSTSIRVRRPNLVSDSAVVKVVSYDALVVAKYGPYKIDPVMDRYGGFIENNQLSVIAIDNAENLYIIERVPRPVHKVTPDGENTVIGEAERIVTDAKIGPDGNLILLMNNRAINMMNVETGEETEWLSLNKKVSYGDFDINGNFYTGGRRSDLFVIAPDLSNTTIGVYAADEIFWVRVYDGYVYLLVEIRNSDENNPALAIWRHRILDTEGNLGDRELVLNWAETGEYAESEVYTFTFSESGVMYISTNNPNPILMVYPDGRQDILYKEILPFYAQVLSWGNGKYLYMILGGEEWNVVRIDMGEEGAPYYGRQ